MSSTQPTENGQTPNTPAPALYDAAAQQRLAFKVERRGKLYGVIHVVDPILEDDIIAYERSRDVRLSDADSSESDAQDALAMTSKTSDAAVTLWDTRVPKVENYALKHPEGDWQKEIAVGDKVFAINQVLAIEFVPLPVASTDEACPPDDDDTSAYPMRALFNGSPVNLKHTLRRATPEEITEFNGLMSRALLVQGTAFGQTDQRIPSRAKGLGKLYRQCKVEAEGYTERVPLHHQMAVALRHFRTQIKSDAKK